MALPLAVGISPYFISFYWMMPSVSWRCVWSRSFWSSVKQCSSCAW